MSKGLFITFEGIDGCGKTTQIKLLEAYLKNKNYSFYSFREPGGNKISEKIRALILDNENSLMCAQSELLLYVASRFQLMHEEIIPRLKAGVTVICDRFYDSTTAYQGYGRGLDLDFIQVLNHYVTDKGTYKPDLTFYLDILPEVAASRRDSRGEEINRMETENQLFFTRVREGYLQTAQTEKERFRIIDATQSIEDMQKEIVGFLESEYK